MFQSLSCFKKTSFEWHFRAIARTHLFRSPVNGKWAARSLRIFSGWGYGVGRNARKFVWTIRVKLPQAVRDKEHPQDLQASGQPARGLLFLGIIIVAETKVRLKKGQDKALLFPVGPCFLSQSSSPSEMAILVIPLQKDAGNWCFHEGVLSSVAMPRCRAQNRNSRTVQN